MKKLFLISTTIFVLTVANIPTIAQGVWTQKANLPSGPRYDGKAFSIGNKGYIGTGAQPLVGRLNDLWEYDSPTNTWTQKTNFGGVGRDGGVGFSIGSKGYIGTGMDDTGSAQSDFWEYDPSSNTWTQKANYGGGHRMDMEQGFSIMNKGYCGTGQEQWVGNHSDFWEYDPSTDTWIQMANFGGGARVGVFAFSIGCRGYMGTGTGGSADSLGDFWEFYDPTNTSCIENINEFNNLISISVYPNPFSTQTTLQTDNYFHNVTLTVYNCFGQAVAQLKNISGQSVTLHRDNLPGGLYFVRLIAPSPVLGGGRGEVLYTGKLVITDER